MEKTNKNRDSKKDQKVKKGRADTSNPAPGSMSEGNLSNSRTSRERTRTSDTKRGVTGSDSDGQSV